MKNTMGWLVGALLLLSAAKAFCGGIYSWTDAAGVRHFSNAPPEAGTGVVTELQETPHDPQADLQRQSEDARELERLSQQRAAEERQRQEAASAQMQQAPPPEEGEAAKVRKNEEKTAAKRERLIEAGRQLNKPKTQSP
jgi:hypothetical protein